MDADADKALKREALEKRMARLRLLILLNSPAVFWPFMAVFIIGMLFLARSVVAASGHHPASWREIIGHTWFFLALYEGRAIWQWWKEQRQNSRLPLAYTRGDDSLPGV